MTEEKHERKGSLEPEDVHRFGDPEPEKTPVLDSKWAKRFFELDRSPIRPIIAGLLGLLFTPMASMLITYVNLRRMGYKRKAQLVIRITVVVYYVYIIIFQHIHWTWRGPVSLAVFLLCLPFVFPNLQRKEYLAWKVANPDKKPESWVKGIKWGILGWIVLFFITLMAILPFAIWNLTLAPEFCK